MLKKVIIVDTEYKGTVEEQVYFILPKEKEIIKYYFFGIKVYETCTESNSKCTYEIDNVQKTKKLGFK